MAIEGNSEGCSKVCELQQQAQSHGTLSNIPAALSKLHRRERLVLVAICFEKKSYRELAECLGVHQRTVEKYLCHAIGSIKNTLRESASIPPLPDDCHSKHPHPDRENRGTAKFPIK